MAQSHTPLNRCVRFVFGVAAASRNTRFQAACEALPAPDLHRLDRTSFRLAHSLEHLIGAGDERKRQRDAKDGGTLKIDRKMKPR